MRRKNADFETKQRLDGIAETKRRSRLLPESTSPAKLTIFHAYLSHCNDTQDGNSSLVPMSSAFVEFFRVKFFEL